jgi:hypothetical protein
MGYWIVPRMPRKLSRKFGGFILFVTVLAYRTAFTLLAHGQQLADTLVALGLE